LQNQKTLNLQGITAEQRVTLGMYYKKHFVSPFYWHHLNKAKNQ